MLGNIEYGQDVGYYDDNQASLTDLTYLQSHQAFSDRSLYIRDKKGKVIRNIEKEKITKRKEEKKKRFQRKKLEKLETRQKERNREKELRKKQKIYDDEMQALGLPSAFGKQKAEEDEEKSDSENSAGTHSSDYENPPDYPITHIIEFQSHSKAVTDLDISKSNSNMTAGSLDYSVKFYDFSKMDATVQPFRSFVPMECHPIRSVEYSLDDKHVLVCAGGIQLKIFSKEGRIHYESVRGDMYIADMNNTHGHTNMVTHCAWHPTQPNYLASSSLDSTVRVWDLHGRLVGVDKQLGHKTLHKARTKNFTKLAVNTFAWTNKGNLIAGGCDDGSIQLWEINKGNSMQAKQVNYSAHSGEITCLKFFQDDFRLLSRSFDGTLKLWDIRQINKEVYCARYPCSNYRIQVDMSPDERYILTGTSPDDREQESYLKILTSSFEEVESISFPQPIISVKWHSFFNQIFLGSADKTIKVLYTPHISSGGIVDCIKKAPVEQVKTEIDLQKPIVTPFSLPQFKVSYATKDKIFQRLRDDHVISQKPRGPLFDPAFDGRMSGINTVTQYILSSIHAKPRPEDDPVEALMSYGPESKNPEWVDNAYKKNQPKPIFDYSEESYPEKEFLSKATQQKCKSCGLKLCLCDKRRVKDEPISGIEKWNS